VQNQSSFLPSHQTLITCSSISEPTNGSVWGLQRFHVLSSTESCLQRDVSVCPAHISILVASGNTSVCMWCVCVFVCLCLQLALRLHPDKNKAHKADEAFKLLSKAFSCLSNPDKRAYYDRYVTSRGGRGEPSSCNRCESATGQAPSFIMSRGQGAPRLRLKASACGSTSSTDSTATLSAFLPTNCCVEEVTAAPCARQRLLSVLRPSLHGQSADWYIFASVLACSTSYCCAGRAMRALQQHRQQLPAARGTAAAATWAMGASSTAGQRSLTLKRSSMPSLGEGPDCFWPDIRTNTPVLSRGAAGAILRLQTPSQHFAAVHHSFRFKCAAQGLTLALLESVN